jgi:hypothetical protein
MSSGRDVRRRRSSSAIGVVATVATVATVVLLAGCGAAPSAPSAAAGSTVGTASLSDLTQAFLTYAQCARTHGLPDLPDPVVDVQGNDSYPGYAAGARPRWPQSVISGCASVWDHVHAVRAAYDASHGMAERGGGAMTPAQALAFSRCIRQHGFPGYPDPGPDGTVHDQPPGFDKRNLSEAAKAAIITCSHQVLHG